MLTVEVRDATLATVAIVDNYTTLTTTQKWWDTGAWVLELPTAAPEVADLLNPGSGIVVRDGTSIVFSGPADTGPDGLVVVRRELAVTDTGQTDTTTVTGSDDMVWLADRVAHPSPLDDHPATQDYDINTGPASTVIWQYVNENCGPGAVPWRQVPLLAMAPDPAVGPVITAQARWQNLLVFLADPAISAGVGVTVAQVGRLIVVTVAAVADQTANVVLSPQFGDLADVVYQTTRTTSSAIYMGAQGDLSDRVVGVASTPGVRRVETFVDRRDVTDPGEVAALAVAALADAAGTTALTVTPSDSDPYRYGVDYRLGDTVTIDVDGTKVTATVTTVTTVLDAAGMTRTIGVGDTSTPFAQLYDSIRGLSARLNQLERQ